MVVFNGERSYVSGPAKNTRKSLNECNVRTIIITQTSNMHSYEVFLFFFFGLAGWSVISKTLKCIYVDGIPM